MYLQLNPFLWLFSDELQSTDPERCAQADGNYPGSRSTNPRYLGQISVLLITFCPPSFPTEIQLDAVFPWCLPCRAVRGGCVLLWGWPRRSSKDAQSCLPRAAEQDCHVHNFHGLCKFFLVQVTHLLSKNFCFFLCVCLSIKRAFKCRFSALHI